MTEQEWMASDNPAAMLEWLRIAELEWMTATDAARDRARMASDRKLRLFAAACREHFYGSAHNGGTESRSEGDSRSRDEELSAERAAMLWATEVHQKELRTGFVRCIFGNPFRPSPLFWEGDGLPWVPAPDSQPGSRRWVGPAWLTPDVRAIAQRIYDERDWASLPVLADALESAGLADEISPCPTCSPYRDDDCPRCGSAGKTLGCDTCDNTGRFPPGYHPERDPASGREEGGWTNCKTCNSGGSSDTGRPGVVVVPHPLLAHLRDGGPHCLGCHVLDLVLGKE